MRQSSTHTLRTFDGVELSYRHWPARSQPAAGAIVLFHRGHEHSGRMAHLVDELGLDGFDFFAWDARGHGQSEGPRGFSPSVAASVRDVDDLVAEIGRRAGHAPERIAVIGQSVGAALISTWLHDYAPRIRCAVLAAPAFSVKLYVPFALPALAALRRLRGDFPLQSYVKSRLLTHDPKRAAEFDADPLISRSISASMLLDLHATSARIVADAQAITVPVQLLISGSDWVVRRAPQEAFFHRLSSPVKELHVLRGHFHDTLGERDRGPALGRVRSFIEDRFAEPRTFVDLGAADRAGHTRAEADRLLAAPGPLSARGLYWTAVRLAMRLGGLLSDGIALGHETGFDSGSTLDYVYRDVAGGRSPLGRIVDRHYLDAIGWRGIRQRKLHVEELVRDAMARLDDAGRPLHLLDVAAGHGRYVLDAVRAAPTMPLSIELRDRSQLNVQRGRQLIAARGLDGMARFVVADAFDRKGLAAVRPRPTVAIVSGLYELFADNESVARSLQGLADAVPAGGYLIYTGQPWHPQLELIARALTSHRDGKPWVMRRRTQAELDQLVARAGFTKVAQRIDPWGIFTVSLAVRTVASSVAMRATA